MRDGSRIGPLLASFVLDLSQTLVLAVAILMVTGPGAVRLMARAERLRPI